ncbi:dienelactone hydrolase family protein [Methylobrevis pamukkalensis]|uniref:Dienelactone hydrolase family protein n=1 Tax=Methylobrevis pamukkalensis TaxID=1439726 RepID=A0A1E3H2F5_9HYPH|nr:dienelactone hydrolase family protein [Methylobrevis pamukkalensis]ODN70513.1 Dienelactone hydrolase family protein [Methylobrevis pamukkalensis]
MRLVSAAAAAAVVACTTLAAQAGETVTYTAGDMEMEGYFAPAANGTSKGAVLVIHDWDGLDSYETKRADMLAGLGYDAFAVDLFGKGVRPDTVDGRRTETGKLYADRALMRERLLAGIAEMREKGAASKTVVMGYCFGGAASLELARSGEASDVVGYASFHGGLATPEGQSFSKETPALLIAHGGADTSVPMTEVATLSTELEAAGVPYEIEVYSGAPHAFTVFGSDRYREVADKKSWSAFETFLEERLPM